jgi:hypothetical protein
VVFVNRTLVLALKNLFINQKRRPLIFIIATKQGAKVLIIYTFLMIYKYITLIIAVTNIKLDCSIDTLHLADCKKGKGVYWYFSTGLPAWVKNGQTRSKFLYLFLVWWHYYLLFTIY